MTRLNIIYCKAVEYFKKHHYPTIRSGSRKAYDNSLNKLLEYVKETYMHPPRCRAVITETFIYNVWDHVKSIPLENVTKNNHITQIKFFVRQIKKAGVIPSVPDS